MNASKTRFVLGIAIALSTILLAAVMLVCIPQAQAVETAADNAAQATTVQTATATWNTVAKVPQAAESDAQKASGVKSAYGILAKNGRLYPASKKGKKIGTYWRVGSKVTYIFVASNCTKVPTKVKYSYQSRYTYSSAITIQPKIVNFKTSGGKSSVKYLGESVFKNASSLVSVKNFSKTRVATIPKYAFYSTSISKIGAPVTLNYIKPYAFAYCTKLKSFVGLQKSRLKVVGSYAFAGASAIPAIALPMACYEIGERAFAGCTKLTKLYMPRKAEVTVGYNFIAQSGIDRGASGAAIYVPSSMYWTYYDQGYYDVGTEWPYYYQYLVRRG